MNIIERKDYIDQIDKFTQKGAIVVLVGQRRVGKSFLLRSFMELKSKEAEANIIFIDKEKREFDDIATYQDLNNFIQSKWIENKSNYILIDEVQDIKEFERSVRSFRTEPDTYIVITGSNARMLSSELSTLIGGRYKEIYIQSLSYKEFLKFHEMPDDEASLAQYIQYGGLPGLSKIGLDAEDARAYLQDVYHTVLLKDVIARNEIRNVPFLENLVTFIADNSGKLISVSNISRFMKSHGENVSPAVINNYLLYLEQAYIIRSVKRYDIHGKQIFENNGKYYFEDNGIRNVIVGGTREGDIEKVIENIIYKQMLKLGYQVYVGVLKVGEIDFVGVKPDGQRVYVQAAYLIGGDDTREREFGNLRKIRDNYPKYVVSMSPLVSRNDDNGIIHLGLRKFLMDGFC